MGRIVQTHIPKPVFALHFGKGFGHSLQIFNILLPVRCIFRNDGKRFGQSGNHPTVTTAPIRIFPVWLGIRRIKICIPPPESVFRIKKSVTSYSVSAFHIHLVHFFEIAVVIFQHTHFGKNRHPHLYGVNPVPIVVLGRNQKLLHTGTRVF